jgi:hypothetical protein
MSTIDGMKPTGDFSPKSAISKTAEEAKAPEAPASEPKDKATIGERILDVPRKAIGAVVGTATAGVAAATNLIPSFVEGGVRGTEPGHKAGAYGVVSVLEYGALGATGGAITFGPLGALIGGAGGLVVGGLRQAIYYATDSDDRVKDAIGKDVDKAVSDNVPTDNKRHDVARDFTEGAFVGAKAGVVEGAKVGFDEGTGVVDGLFEGMKGIGTVITGSYPSPAQPTKAPGSDESVLKKVLKLPKKALEVTVGIASGAVGAVMATPQGVVQGVRDSVKLAGGEQIGDEYAVRSDAKLFRRLTVLEAMATGAAVGFMTSGIVGAGIGVVTGLIGGAIIARFERKGHADVEIAKGISNAMEFVHGDNEKTGSGMHDKVRDTIEGVVTGTAAGMKEGFRAGYEGGKGAVDGVIEGVAGVISGIIGGVSGK